MKQKEQMPNAINTKVLYVIIFVLAGMNALLTLDLHEMRNANAAITRTASSLAQQLQVAEAQKAHDDTFRGQVEAKRKQSHSFPGNESGTWQHYIP